MNLGLTIGGYAAAAVLLFLWVGAREDLATEIEAANTRVMTSVAEAQRVTRETERKAAERRFAQLESMAENERKARETADAAAEQAKTAEIQLQARVLDLELEADINEIPDSTDCLIVFVPGGVLPAEDCGETDSSGSGDGGVCAGTGRVIEANTGFSNITFGDSLKIWATDRSIIGTLNGQLMSIESLEIESE